MKVMTCDNCGYESDELNAMTFFCQTCQKAYEKGQEARGGSMSEYEEYLKARAEEKEYLELLPHETDESEIEA